MKINEFFVDQPAKSCLRRLELRKEKVLGDVQISRLFFYTANVIPAAGSAVVAAATGRRRASLPSSADIAASRVVYLRSYHIICSWHM